MRRLDHNRTRAQLAHRAGVPLESVARVTVCRNHSPTMVPDAWHATIDGQPALEVVDHEWITASLIPLVQERGAQLIEVWVPRRRHRRHRRSATASMIYGTARRRATGRPPES